MIHGVGTRGLAVFGYLRFNRNLEFFGILTKNSRSLNELMDI